MNRYQQLQKNLNRYDHQLASDNNLPQQKDSVMYNTQTGGETSEIQNNFAFDELGNNEQVQQQQHYPLTTRIGDPNTNDDTPQQSLQTYHDSPSPDKGGEINWFNYSK